jgi:hypothetical protein
MSVKKAEKTNPQRVEELYKICEEHFGDVRFVGLKYHTKVGWVAKVNFEAEFDTGCMARPSNNDANAASSSTRASLGWAHDPHDPHLWDDSAIVYPQPWVVYDIVTTL